MRELIIGIMAIAIIAMVVIYYIVLRRISGTKWLSIILTIFMGFFAICVFFLAFFFTRQSNNGDSNRVVSRYEWIRMLTDTFGINEYQSTSPYFVDVPSDNPYFESVQSACEWKIINPGNRFEGDKPVTGEYAALSAMKAVGDYKVKIYLKLDDMPTDDDYRELAIEKGLVSKRRLNTEISEDEALEMIEKVREMYMTELWADDYVDIDYTDAVREVDDSDVVSFNPNENRIVLSGNALSKLKVGNVIILANPYNGAKMSKRIVSINEDGKTELEDASLDDTFEHLVISDTVEVTSDELFEGILSAYGDDMAEASQNENYGLLLTKDEEGQYRHDGVGIDIEVKADSTILKFTNYKSNTTVSKEIPGVSLKNAGSFDESFFNDKISMKGTDKIEAAIDIRKINIGVQTDYAPIVGCNYFVTQTEMDVTSTFKAGGNVEFEIPLTPTPIPLVGFEGWISLNLELKLICTLDGNIELVMETKPQDCFEYHKESGCRYVDNTASPTVDAYFEADFKGKIRIEPSIEILFNKIADLEVDIGAGAEAKVTTRNNSDIKSCIDVNAYAPTLSYGWLNDEESLLRALVPAKEVTIWDSDNAPYIKSFHFEWYGGSDIRNPARCTYINSMKDTEEAISTSEEGDDFSGQKLITFTRNRDGVCEGTLSDFICFDYNLIQNASPGDVLMTSNGTEEKYVAISRDEVDEYYGFGPSIEIGDISPEVQAYRARNAEIGIRTPEGEAFYLFDDLHETGDTYYAIDDLHAFRVTNDESPEPISFVLDDSIDIVFYAGTTTEPYELTITGTEFMSIPTNPPGNYDWNEGTYTYKGHVIIKPGEKIFGYAEFDSGRLIRIYIAENPDLVS